MKRMIPIANILIIAVLVFTFSEAMSAGQTAEQEKTAQQAREEFEHRFKEFERAVAATYAGSPLPKPFFERAVAATYAGSPLPKPFDAKPASYILCRVAHENIASAKSAKSLREFGQKAKAQQYLKLTFEGPKSRATLTFINSLGERVSFETEENVIANDWINFGMAVLYKLGARAFLVWKNQRESYSYYLESAPAQFHTGGNELLTREELYATFEYAKGLLAEIDKSGDLIFVIKNNSEILPFPSLFDFSMPAEAHKEDPMSPVPHSQSHDVAG